MQNYCSFDPSPSNSCCSISVHVSTSHAAAAVPALPVPDLHLACAQQRQQPSRLSSDAAVALGIVTVDAAVERCVAQHVRQLKEDVHQCAAWYVVSCCVQYQWHLVTEKLILFE